MSRVGQAALYANSGCFQTSERRFKDDSTPGPGPGGYNVTRTKVEKDREKKHQAKGANFLSITERKLAMQSKEIISLIL